MFKPRMQNFSLLKSTLDTALKYHLTCVWYNVRQCSLVSYGSVHPWQTHMLLNENVNDIKGIPTQISIYLTQVRVG